MKSRNKCLVSVILCSVSCCQAQADGSSDLAIKMDSYLTAYENMGFSGAVLVAEKGKVTLSKGYGMADDSSGAKASEKTIWAIGSITKPFTAAAILKLEMEGKLSVSDAVGKHVEGLDAEKGAVTIHQLLTHSAGVREYSGRDSEPMSKKQFIEFLNASPLAYSPGERFAYSNVGYSLLGIVVEEVSGQSYEQYLRGKLFDPSGMTDTGYNRKNWNRENFAKGYKPNGDEWGSIFVENNYENASSISWNLKANGGILSTPVDMFRWSESLKKESVLSVEAKQKYFGEHIETPGDFSLFTDRAPSHYGYGWAVAKSSDLKAVIMHGGSNDIYEAGYAYYPEDDVFLFLASNRAKHPVGLAIVDFDKMLADKPYDVPVATEEPVLDELLAALYIGTYVFKDGSTVEVERGSGGFDKWLTITPQDEKSYQKVIGEKVSKKDQDPLRKYAETVLMSTKEGRPFSLLVNSTSPTKRRETKGEQFRHAEFWAESRLKLGAYQGHEYWTTVRVHDRLWVYHRVNFEKGSMYVTHHVGEGELKNVRFSDRVTGLFLKPTEAPDRFREVNNNAVYKFCRNSKRKAVSLEVRSHNKKYNATK